MTDTCRICSSPLPKSGRLCIRPAPASAWSFVAIPTASSEEMLFSLEITTCSSCGLTQRIGLPIPEYRQVRTAALLSPSMRDHRRHQAQEFIDNYNLGQSIVVEIGTGRGELLPILGEMCFHADGTEYGGPRLDSVQGVSIINTYPGISCWPPKIWDAAWCLNFLEHTPDPLSFMRGVGTALLPGAPILLEVPDYSQQLRLDRYFDYVSDHMSYFDENSLRLLLGLSGFHVERLRSVRGGENIEVWAVKRHVRSHKHESQYINAARLELDRFCSPLRNQGGLVGVWGASHQALLLLASISDDTIDFVLDSSPDKQGMYTPVSHIPIISPTAKAIRSLRGIIIIASGYESEIISQLAQLGYSGVIAYMDGAVLRQL